jgi:hypothetical protein
MGRKIKQTNTQECYRDRRNRRREEKRSRGKEKQLRDGRGAKKKKSYAHQTERS